MAIFSNVFCEGNGAKDNMRAQASIEISQPIEIVFACIASRKFIHRWIAPFRSNRDLSTTQKPDLHQVTEGAVGLGTIFLQSNESANQPLEATIEVVEYRYPIILFLDIKLGTHISRVEFILKTVAEGTKMTILLRPKRQHPLLKFIDTLGAFAQSTNVNPSYNLQDMKEYIEEQC